MNISFAFITQSSFLVPNDVRLNSTQYLTIPKAAKISALLSGKLEKNEYLTGKDLALKAGPTEKIQINIFH